MSENAWSLGTIKILIVFDDNKSAWMLWSEIFIYIRFRLRKLTKVRAYHLLTEKNLKEFFELLRNTKRGKVRASCHRRYLLKECLGKYGLFSNFNNSHIIGHIISMATMKACLLTDWVECVSVILYFKEFVLTLRYRLKPKGWSF